MKKRSESGVETPIASLIDVVFLLIIFFVVTASVEKDVVDGTIKLAQAKYAKEIEKKDPRTITINLHENGQMNIALQRISPSALERVLKATVAKGGNSVPILVRSDAATKYAEVDKVIGIVGKAGLYRVRLAAEATGESGSKE